MTDTRTLLAIRTFDDALHNVVQELRLGLRVEEIEVKPGDTLASLARDNLGSTTRWLELYLMNLEELIRYQRIHNVGLSPDLIYPGQKLRLLRMV